MWLIGFLLFSLFSFSAGSAYVFKATIVNSFFARVGDTHLPAPAIDGNKIRVREGESFQSALNRAKPGDTIFLQAGATFTGAFELPNKNGSRYITIRSSASDLRLPPAGQRIDPEKYRFVLPKLESNVKGKPVVLASKGAHHFRFIGIEFKPTIEGLYNIIQIGTSEERKLADLPHHLEFDRVYIHGSKIYGQRRGIAANGRQIRIINSYISEIKRKGEESQAIAVWSTDGPIEITNNYIEAAAIGILFGGAGSPLELIPTNCIVRNNHINKPKEWKNSKWVVKNMFEIKNGRNIKVEYNLMTNNWAMGQTGTAVLFTTRADNQNVIIEDIVFSNNIVRGSGNAINVYGSEGLGGKNLIIRNNVFDDIDGSKWGGSGHFLLGTEWNGLTIENNTIIQKGSITSVYGDPIFNFTFRNNIVYQNAYGFFGDDTSPGKGAISRYFPRSQITNNIIIGSDPSSYGRKNFYPRSSRQIGFRNLNDYRLTKGNPYRTKGFGGKNVGADLDPKMVGGN